MNPHRVKTREQFEQYLASKGLVKTGTKTGTGEFWRSQATGKHIEIPDEVYQDGMVPDFYLNDFEKAVEKISKTGTIH